MNNVKRIFAAMTAAASIGVFSMAAVSASAEETTTAETTAVTTVTTTAYGTGENTDTTTTTDVSGESTTSETTTTTAPSIKFNTCLLVNGIEDENKGEAVLVEKNGEYTASYKFASADELESLVLDASFKADEYESVKITVKKVEFGTDDDKKEVKLAKETVDFDTTVIDGHSVIIILGKAAGEDQQLGFAEGETITPEADKSIYVTFSVEGLQESTDSTTTTTTTKTNSKVYSYGNNSNNNSNRTNTVAQTADAGVVAVVVTATAAAAAAACAMTVRRKKK